MNIVINQKFAEGYDPERVAKVFGDQLKKSQWSVLGPNTREHRALRMFVNIGTSRHPRDKRQLPTLDECLARIDKADWCAARGITPVENMQWSHWLRSGLARVIHSLRSRKQWPANS